MAADELAAMTGMPTAEAVQFLEMAGGDLEAAITLYFDMNAGGGGGAMEQDGGFGGGDFGAAPQFIPPSTAHAVLFGGEAAPPSWSEQGLEFSGEASSACGIIQHKNGPCGVLAVVNAILLAQAGCPGPNHVFDDAALAAALASMIARCAGEKQRAVVAAWSGGPGSEVVETELPADQAGIASFIFATIGAFRAPGGVNLLCYSAILTRGIDVVHADAALDGGGPPLVQGPYALCGTELMGLFLNGIARGGVGAYSEEGPKVTWRTRCDVGMLSLDEVESGIPLADELKNPAAPVYVIHGGDHFTVMWAPPSATAPEGAMDFMHWNGLPPNRAMVQLRLRPCDMATPAIAPERHVQAHWRTKVGEVESIVQAWAEDKKARPGCWRTHSYEIALVTQDVVDDDHSEERPADMPAPPSFEQGPEPGECEAWRCAGCYQTRFKTMCFGENSAPAANICKFCGRARAETGWTLWRAYSDLPPRVQSRVDRSSGPKILSVLRTRWEGADISLFGPGGEEIVLGGEGFDPQTMVSPVA